LIVQRNQRSLPLCNPRLFRASFYCGPYADVNLHRRALLTARKRTALVIERDADRPMAEPHLATSDGCPAPEAGRAKAPQVVKLQGDR
jgi:hypothetical protein